jgi:hypothetical protein
VSLASKSHWSAEPVAHGIEEEAMKTISHQRALNRTSLFSANSTSGRSNVSRDELENPTAITLDMAPDESNGDNETELITQARDAKGLPSLIYH